MKVRELKWETISCIKEMSDSLESSNLTHNNSTSVVSLLIIVYLKLYSSIFYRIDFLNVTDKLFRVFIVK